MFKRKMAVAIAAILGATYSVQSLADFGTAELADVYNAPQATAIANKYIVVYKKPAYALSSDIASANFTASVSNQIQSDFNINVQEQFSVSFNGALITANEAQIEALRANSDIAFIEQDQTISISPMFSARQSNPTWGLDRIDQRALPLDNQFNPGQLGSGVTAYIIDTGVMNSHNDFGGRSRNGYDFIDNDPVSNDCHGHGTHVAGTVGGALYGVAKQVNLVGVKVLGCNGSGSTSGVIRGVEWVANNANGPSVANMSLGGGRSTAMNNAVKGAVDRGVFFAVAAGNDSGNACNKSPASEPTAYTVGSTTRTDNRSSFSNFGNCLDIYAPGSQVTSAWIGNNNATRTISGTSMASPHVAGAAALLLEDKPNLTPTQIANALKNNATSGVVKDPRAGSPNELLYVGGGSAPGLEEIVSGGSKATKKFTYNVPAGSSKLTVKTSGGTGDADLYIKHGIEAWGLDFDCASENADTSNEECVINNPKAGIWHISVFGYTAFNNAKLTVSHN